MKNPPKTPQHSIFEPLFSLHTEHPNGPFPFSSPSTSDPLCQLPCTELADNTAGSPLSTIKRAQVSTSLNHHPSSVIKAEMDPSSAATPKKAKSQHDLLMPASGFDHGNISSSSSPSVGHGGTVSSLVQYRDYVVQYRDYVDDGSVACRLLASITKSNSSPSLLSCCKEPSRETAYQKSLKLKTMKLQYCAEELGSESWDVSSACGDGTFDSFLSRSASMNLADLKFSDTPEKVEKIAASSMTSAMSAPNLRCPSLHTSRITHIMTKERSFPPPLTRSSSFSYSLRPYREDGRFVLREVKVPCRQYFQASRKDGRLTLQLLPTAEEVTVMEENTREECIEVVDATVMEDNNAGKVVISAIELEDLADEEVVSAKSIEVAEALEMKMSKEIDDVGCEDKVLCRLAGCKMEKMMLVAGRDAVENVSVKKVDGGFNGDLHINVISNAVLTKKMWADARLSHEPGGAMHHGAHMVQWKDNVLPENSSWPVLKGLLGGAGRGIRELRQWHSSVGRTPPPQPSTIVFKDGSLMQKISAIVASLGLVSAVAYARDVRFNKVMKGTLKQYCNGGNSINKGRRSGARAGGDRMMSGGGSTDKKEVIQCSNGMLASNTSGIDELVQLDFDMHIPASSPIHLTALLKTNPLLPHTAHCKEIFHRNYELATMPGFIKLNCVAIRS